MNLLKKTIIVIALSGITFNVYSKEGKEIFDNYCTTCHSTSMASMFNAPAVHDLNAWSLRKEDAFKRAVEKNASIKDNEKKEENIINELLNTAINGTAKGMPPKGTCFECTDDELKAAIKFMSSKE